MKTYSFITISTMILTFSSCNEKSNQTKGDVPVDTATAGRIKPEEAANTPKVKNITNTSMNQRLKESWNDAKGKLKQQFPNLTDEDLVYEEGKLDDLYNRLQQKLGKSRSDVVEIIEKSLN